MASMSSIGTSSLQDLQDLVFGEAGDDESQSGTVQTSEMYGALLPSSVNVVEIH